MPTSQNGYTANDRALITSVKVPGGSLTCRKDYGIPEIFAYVAARYHNEVQTLTWPGCWGYAERQIRGSSTTLSNHASGTAIDLNAPKHPLGTSPNANYTRKQRRRIRKILRDCDGVIRWGGDYSGRKDGMHFEINETPAACRALARKVKPSSREPNISHGHIRDIRDAVHQRRVEVGKDTDLGVALNKVGKALTQIIRDNYYHEVNVALSGGASPSKEPRGCGKQPRRRHIRALRRMVHDRRVAVGKDTTLGRNLNKVGEELTLIINGRY